jgi:hypothetical protein
MKYGPFLRGKSKQKGLMYFIKDVSDVSDV